MKEVMLFEASGPVVVAIRFTEQSKQVVRFQIAEAIDYPEINHNEAGDEIFTASYFNLIGPDGPVDTFEQANLLASGNVVYQAGDENPLVYTVEFAPGVIYSGKEFECLTHIIKNNLLIQALLIFTEKELPTVERVNFDFSK